eukprot:ctg_1404.g425
MALAGQGDPRWIVRDMGTEGTNVGQWHWQERDVSRSVQERLRAEWRAAMKALGDGTDYQYELLEPVTVEGDCALYCRKRQWKAVYDWHGEAQWRVQGAEAESCGSGRCRFEWLEPDPEVQFTYEGGVPDVCRERLETQGRASITAAMRAVLENVLAEAQASTADGNDDNRAEKRAAPVTRESATPAPVASKDTTTAAAAAASAQPGTGQFTLRETFFAPRALVFDMLTRPDLIQRYTQSEAVCTAPERGGALALLHGQVVGENLEWQPPERLVQRWRMSDWTPADHYSIVHMTFTERPGGETQLELMHENVPDDALERTRIGWVQQIFGRMRVVFNLGGTPLPIE